MAEALLKKMLPPPFGEKVRVMSAGTHAIEGLPATLQGQSAAREFDVDLSSHNSQPLTPWMIGHSDLILAMEPEHTEYIRRLDPTSCPRTFLLKKFGQTSQPPGETPEVTDPIYGDDSTYRRVYQELFDEVRRILPTVVKVIQSAQ